MAILLLVLAAGAWSAWLVLQTQRNLTDAEDAVRRIQASFETGDESGRAQAVADLKEAAGAAADRTDGVWWSAMGVVPVLGDDVKGVEALSASVDLVSRDVVAPLFEAADSLDGVVSGGRIDPDKVSALQAPVDRAATALEQAAALVGAQDSGSFVSSLRTRYDDYTKRVSDLSGDLAGARKAVQLLPPMLGQDGPRNYLFIFQNNAEIRSTGGLPGSWAQVHVDDGRIELREQGSAVDLNEPEPAIQLTNEEDAVYDELPALFFQDPNFIPDFPRAAEIFNAFWDRRYPEVELDGVLAMDPVAASYLMAGTGPIQAGDLTLTADTIVSELLSNTYLTITDPVEQDLRFQEVARAVLGAVTSDVASPISFIQGIARAAGERRFLIAPFDESEQQILEGTPVLGGLSGDDGDTPHVDIGLNDGTGSKMSYYLRSRATVAARSCADDAQTLEGRMTISQTISPREARALPDYVTGGDAYGIPIGSQLVTLRMYGPYGGDLTDVRFDGQPLDPEYGLTIDGRPVVTVGVLLDSTANGLLTWSMTTGPGQTGGGEVTVTPSVVPGTSDSTFASACAS